MGVVSCLLHFVFGWFCFGNCLFVFDIDLGGLDLVIAVWFDGCCVCFGLGLGFVCNALVGLWVSWLHLSPLCFELLPLLVGLVWCGCLLFVVLLFGLFWLLCLSCCWNCLVVVCWGCCD